jgi:hypothetical protein
MHAGAAAEAPEASRCRVCLGSFEDDSARTPGIPFVSTLKLATPTNCVNRVLSALSAAGGHTLLTLEPENGYAAELAMFGGTTLSGGEATPLHRATMPRRLPGSCAP